MSELDIRGKELEHQKIGQTTSFEPDILAFCCEH